MYQKTYVKKQDNVLKWAIPRKLYSSPHIWISRLPLLSFGFAGVFFSSKNLPFYMEFQKSNLHMHEKKSRVFNENASSGWNSRKKESNELPIEFQSFGRGWAQFMWHRKCRIYQEYKHWISKNIIHSQLIRSCML